MIDAMNVVIILHCASDHRIARRLQTALLEQGFVAELAGQAALGLVRKARAVIVLWSLDSIAEEGLVREALSARRGGRLIQVKAADCDVPAAFGEVDGVQLHGWQGERTDPRFQYVAQAATELMAKAGLFQQPARPKGVGHSAGLIRPILASVVTGILIVATYIGAVQNLDFGRRAVCSLAGISKVCIAMGAAEPAPTFASRIEGRWSPQGATECFEITTRPERDGLHVRSVWPANGASPEYRGHARIVETYGAGKAELVTLEPCRGYREHWSIDANELRIVVAPPDPLSTCAMATTTNYYRCEEAK